MLIGVVDKHLTGLEKVFGVEWVDAYLKKVNILRKSYQGQHALEGNQSSMFLKKLPFLAEQIMSEPDELKIEGLALLESLRCFKKVQASCFGQDLNKVHSYPLPHLKIPHLPVYIFQAVLLTTSPQNHVLLQF